MRFTEESMIRDLEDYHVVRGYRVLDKCKICGVEPDYWKQQLDNKYTVRCPSCGGLYHCRRPC